MLKRYQPVWGFQLVYKPRYLGGVMVGSGNKPPATLPNKGEYLLLQLRLVTSYPAPIVSKMEGCF